MSRLEIFMVALPLVIVIALSILAVKGDVMVGYIPVEQAAFGYETGSSLDDVIGDRARHGDIPSTLRGPFRYLQGAPAASEVKESDGALHLTFVLIAEDQKIAIISGNIAREGETLFGRKITAVEKDRVALTQNGETQWIFLQVR